MVAFWLIDSVAPTLHDCIKLSLPALFPFFASKGTLEESIGNKLCYGKERLSRELAW